MTVKITLAPSRLSRLAFRPGGLSPESAVGEAERRVGDLAPRTLAAIDGLLVELEAACAPPVMAAEAAAAQVIHIAGAIVSLAGAVGLAPLSQAAAGLCSLASTVEESGVWATAAVEVHLQALRYLRDRPSEADAARLLAGLHSL